MKCECGAFSTILVENKDGTVIPKCESCYLNPSFEDNKTNSLLETLAAVQHEIWSHWMRCLFSICPTLDNGEVVIPMNEVLKWSKQIGTPYSELSEKEKESDRDQARKVLAILEDKP